MGDWPVFRGGRGLTRAWRVAKSRTTGSRWWGKRDSPDGQCRGGCEDAGWLVGWMTVTSGSGGIGMVVARCGFSGIMLLVFPTSFRPDFPPSRVNRILAKTIIHLSFFHSFWAFLAPFSLVWIFDRSIVRVGSLYVSLSYLRFSVRFPQPVPYIHERKESPKSFEIRKGTYSW